MKATTLKKDDQKADAESVLADPTLNYDDIEAQKEAYIDVFALELKRSLQVSHDLLRHHSKPDRHRSTTGKFLALACPNAARR